MSLSSELEQIILDASDRVAGLSTAAEREEYAAQRFVQASFADFVGKTGASATAAASGGRALTALMYSMRLINWLGWFIAAVQINKMVASALGKIPIVGGGVRKVFEWGTYGVARLLLGHVTGQLGVNALNFASSWVQSVGWAGTSVHHYVTRDEVNQLILPPSPIPGLPSPTLSGEVSTLKLRTTHLQQEIDSIEYRLDHPANRTGTAPQVWAEIHAAQRAIRAQNNAITDMRTEISNVRDQQQAIEHRMATLASQLHGISSIAVTWQDISHEVDQLGNQVTSLANQTAQDLRHQERQIEQLAPLGLLLQPGMPGLRVLRSLEDRPCQCPEFGNVPNWLGTALAVEDFVANG